MNIDQIATTQLNNTKIHLLQTEFDELILALEKWNQPNNARPYGESNAYIIKLNHPPQETLQILPTIKPCDKCGTHDNFIYLTNAYLETNPNYIRTHNKQKYCKNCLQKPKETLLQAFEHFQENITAVKI